MTTGRCKGVSWGGRAERLVGGRVCDVVVTPFDLRRLEMAPQARIGSLLLLYLG